MALWAGRFTPHIVMQEECGLLLEVAGSLKLFGGLRPLLQALKADLRAMRYRAHIAAAPSSRAAWWLAQATPGRILLHVEQLAPVLRALPLDVLDCAEKPRALLKDLGLHSVGDLLALPRAGIAKRFGKALLDQIDQALGRQAQPHIYFAAPAQFDVRVELPSEVAHVEALAFVLKRLLIQLGAFLGARLGAIRAFELRLEYRNAAPSVVRIGLVAPSRDADHLFHLSQERLARLQLTEPVRAIGLHAHDLLHWGGANASLLDDESTQAEEWPKLVEQLGARLGAANVQGLRLEAAHRPEAASVAVEVNTASEEMRFPLRPFWLLPVPLPLQEHDASPHYEGALKLIAGPERIRSGWWDGRPASRDYFIAQTPSQALLWVFREAGRGWFLHGRFA